MEEKRASKNNGDFATCPIMGSKSDAHADRPNKNRRQKMAKKLRHKEWNIQHDTEHAAKSYQWIAKHKKKQRKNRRERERNGCSKTRGGFVVFKARKSCRTFCAVMRKPHPDGFLPISSSYWDLFKSNSKGRQSEPEKIKMKTKTTSSAAIISAGCCCCWFSLNREPLLGDFEMTD